MLPCLRTPLVAQRVPVKRVFQRLYSTSDDTPSQPRASPSQPADAPKNDDNSSSVEQMLLHATLKHVPSLGWTRQSMAQGAQDLGLSSAVQGVFSGGPSGLVDAYLQDCRRQFVQNIEREYPDLVQDPSMTSRVRRLTRLRLKLLEPYAHRWPEALATTTSSPTAVTATLGHLADIVDDIWYFAGDRSPDMNWYTKRASLAAVYSATELYMSQDLSEDYVETYRFLDRRLEDAACVGSTASQLGTMLSFGAKSFIGMVDQRGRR